MLGSIFTVLLAAVAIPYVASDPALQKRSTDGVYLAHCWETKNNTFTSQMPYYANALTGSQNGELPDDNTYPNPNGVVTWEGNRVCSTYAKTGVQFCSSIVADALDYAVGQFAGPGTNEYSGFNCFRDNGRRLFEQTDASTGFVNDCYSMYYCFQVDQPEG